LHRNHHAITTKFANFGRKLHKNGDLDAWRGVDGFETGSSTLKMHSYAFFTIPQNILVFLLRDWHESACPCTGKRINKEKDNAMKQKK
jgi:hypothetical protein